MAKPNRRKRGMSVNVNLEELAKADGAVRGLAATVQTDRFIVPLVKGTHANLANRFDMDMSMAALSQGAIFHHVYEWGALGVEDASLWKHQLKGHGSNRFATWDWRASKVPIPSPQERASDPNDPMSLVSSDKVARFSERKHIFVWKAPTMEYGLPVTITPKYAQRLVFPVWDPEDPLRSAMSVTVENPGGDGTTGSFTSFWASWWNTVAPKVFEQTIETEIEYGIEEATMAAVRRGSRSVDSGISTLSYEAAMKQGQTWASTNLNKFSQRYMFNNEEFWEDGD